MTTGQSLVQRRPDGAALVIAGLLAALGALLIWQGSPAHRSVILNEGSWSGIPFHGMGVGIVGNYAVLWFGDAVDPGGTMGPCGNEIVFSTSFE